MVKNIYQFTKKSSTTYIQKRCFRYSEDNKYLPTTQVTMNHNELPQKLQDIGGWMNSSIVNHMRNYADILFKEYGEKVDC